MRGRIILVVGLLAVIVACSGDSSSATAGSDGECLSSPGGSPVALADNDVVCGDHESPSKALSLDVSMWPEFEIFDCLSTESIEVKASCVVTQLVQVETRTEVHLSCTDTEIDALEHELILSVDSQGFAPPVCESDAVNLYYHRENLGCYASTLTYILTDDNAQVIAAKVDGNAEASIASLSVSILPDAGCSTETGICTASTRAAFRIADKEASAIVYDGTRRVVQLTDTYIIQVQALLVDVWDNCEALSTYRIELVRQ